MNTPIPDSRIDHARSMRRKPTWAESYLWRLFRGHRFGGVKFRRQHPRGRYTIDFFAPSVSVAVEVDGDSHLEELTQDRRRDADLESEGILTLRFWNHELARDPERVLGKIWSALEFARGCLAPSPGLRPPSREGGGDSSATDLP